MTRVSAYWRPATVPDALALLRRSGTVPIGGGTKVNAAPDGGPVEIIDLQALGLGRIERQPGALDIGAGATLQQIATDAAVPAVVREAARREEPSTLRAMATLGGCVAAGHWESELLAALLAYAATVTLAGPDGDQLVGLDALLADRGRLADRIITSVVMATGGAAQAARTGRTQADRPIVAAVARQAGGTWLALSGVAATPVLTRAAGADLPGWLDRLDPPGDFRGSAEYRRALAATLARRVLEAVS
jgi:probable selenate reductase FAD-binding subunit